MVRLLVPLVLILLLGIIHTQMWFGPGGVPKVAELQQQLDTQKAANAAAKIKNEQLASEVADLKGGLGMVEEKARMELGMVRPNEIFVQITPASTAVAPLAANAAAAPTPPKVSNPAANRR